MKFKFFAFFVAAVMVLLSSCKKDSQLDDDKNDIKKYLQENGIQAQKTDRSLYYVVVEEGTGQQCKEGDKVAIKYKVTSISYPNDIIDQTTKHAYECQVPTTVPNSYADIIMGLQMGLITMREGGKSIFYIPSSYAYGSKEIGSNKETYANLIFECELCEILTKN